MHNWPWPIIVCLALALSLYLAQTLKIHHAIHETPGPREIPVGRTASLILQGSAFKALAKIKIL